MDPQRRGEHEAKMDDANDERFLLKKSYVYKCIFTAKACFTTDLLGCPTGPPFNEIANIGMTSKAAKEAALGVVLPQDNIKLFSIIEDKLIVRLRRKRGVKIPWGEEN